MKHGTTIYGRGAKKRETIKIISLLIKLLIIVNICTILFMRFFSKGNVNTSVPTIWFYISLIISVIVLLAVFSNKLLKNKALYVIIILAYIILMVCLPVYKKDIQETVIDENRTNYKVFAGVNYTITYEETKDFTDYYNAYGLRLKRNEIVE